MLLKFRASFSNAVYSPLWEYSHLQISCNSKVQAQDEPHRKATNWFMARMSKTSGLGLRWLTIYLPRHSLYMDSWWYLKVFVITKLAFQLQRFLSRSLKSRWDQKSCVWSPSVLYATAAAFKTKPSQPAFPWVSLCSPCAEGYSHQYICLVLKPLNSV